MAKAGQNSRSGNGGGWNDVQFVNVSWNQEIDRDFEAWLKGDAPTVEEALQWMAMEGYKLSIRYDLDSSTFCTTAIQSKSKHVHSGYAFTGWDDSADGSIFVAMFKLSVMFNGVSPKDAVKSASGRR